jgi:hypothetical protein
VRAWLGCIDCAGECCPLATGGADFAGCQPCRKSNSDFTDRSQSDGDDGAQGSAAQDCWVIDEPNLVYWSVLAYRRDGAVTCSN